MPWSWNESSHRYHDSATGRFMGRDEVLGYVQQSLDAARTAPAITLADGSLSTGTDLLANLVGNGMLSPRDWHAQMREEIKAEYIRQYMLGRGGRGNMTAKDWGSIGGMVADQYRYLKDFAKLVAEGKLSEAQIRARAAMYVNSAREGFERGQARAFGLPELPAYPGDGQTICLTNCACSWQIEEVYEGEVLTGWDCYWTLGIVKTEHCDDCLDNTGKWNPLFISASYEVVGEPHGVVSPTGEEGKVVEGFTPADNIDDALRLAEDYKLTVVASPETIAQFMADAYEQKYGWDITHTRKEFIKNQIAILKDARAPESYQIEVINAAAEQIYQGAAEPFPLVVRGEREGYNDRWVVAEYDQTHISFVYHQKPVAVELQELGQAPSTISATYVNPLGGTYVHEYGHHYTAMRSEIIQRASAVIDEEEDSIKQYISRYAIANPRELAAEAFAARQHPEYSTLSVEAKRLIAYILEGE